MYVFTRGGINSERSGVMVPLHRMNSPLHGCKNYGCSICALGCSTQKIRRKPAPTIVEEAHMQSTLESQKLLCQADYLLTSVLGWVRRTLYGFYCRAYIIGSARRKKTIAMMVQIVNN